DGDRTFGGDVAGLLGGLDGTGGAHVVDGLLDVTTGGNQGLLALHHALAGALAQFLDQGCSNLCHVRILCDGFCYLAPASAGTGNPEVAKRGPSPLLATKPFRLSLRPIRPARRRTLRSHRRRWRGHG